MNKYSAVYYPHTSMRSIDMLKESLLLWDHVDCIVPYQGYSITQGFREKNAEACELILRAREPENIEKQKVRQSISELVKDGTPEWIRNISLLIDNNSPETTSFSENDYLIYPQKFDNDTWKILSELDLSIEHKQTGDYALPSSLGMYLMAELAKSMSGQTQNIITDREAAYSLLFSSIGSELSGEPNQDLLQENSDVLFTLPIPTLDISSIDLGRVLRLRKKEESEGGNDFKILRHNFLDQVRELVNNLTIDSTLTINDRKELTRQFKEKMEIDMNDLKSELGMARTELLCSKEVGVTALASIVGTLVAEPLGIDLTSFSPLGIGPIFLAGKKYQNNRRKALKDHASSWLFLASRKGIMTF